MGKGSDIYQWGIIGEGEEAEAFARAITDVVDAKLQAVVQSTGGEKKRPYLQEAATKYESVDDIVLSDDVDLLYVASSSSLKAKHIRAALSCGVGVVYRPILEVPTTELESLFSLARKKNVLLLEGITPRFLPPIQRISEVVAEGAIGEVLELHADASYLIPFNPQHPFFGEEGGILRQYGLHPLFFVSCILGAPEKMTGYLQVGLTGVEEQYALILRYSTGVYALLSASCTLYGTCEAYIIGSRSRIHLHAPFYGQTTVSLYSRERRSGLMKFNYPSNEYYHLIEEAQRCQAAACYESTLWGHAHTRQLAELLERCRKELHIQQESPNN